jgi:hypothetical protein
VLEPQFWAMWIVLGAALLFWWTVAGCLFAFLWGLFCLAGQGPKRGEAGAVRTPASDGFRNHRCTHAHEDIDG